MGVIECYYQLDELVWKALVLIWNLFESNYDNNNYYQIVLFNDD